MVNKEEILKDILLKISYDSSKTLNENIQEQASYIPQSDNTRVDPSYLGLTSDGKPISMLPQGESVTYTGGTKPTPPEQGQIFSQSGRPIDYSSVPFFATYYSPRLEKLKCRGYGPSSTKVSSKIPNNQSKLNSKKMCLGKDGQRKLISVYKQDLKDWEDKEWINNLDNILTVVEIGAFLIAPFTGPFAPIFYGVGVAAGLGTAKIAYDKGDTHSALILAALSIIPEGKLIGRSIKQLYKAYGKKQAISLVEQYAKGKLKDEATKKTIQSALKDIATNPSQYKNLLKASAKETIKKGIVNKPLRVLVLFAYGLSKFGITIGVMIGGTYYAADKLYMALYGDDEDRQNSEMRKIADLVVQMGELAVAKLLGKEIESVIDNANEKDMVSISKSFDFAVKHLSRTPLEMKKDIDVTKSLSKIFGEPINRTKKNGIQFRVGEFIITFYRNYRFYNTATKKMGNWKFIGDNSVTLDGKRYDGKFEWKQNNLTIDDIKNGKGIVKFGDEGDIVKKIQKELFNFGFKGVDGEPIFKGKEPDGKFGKNTKLALKTFQDYYGIKDDGIVGKDTIMALTEV